MRLRTPTLAVAALSLLIGAACGNGGESASGNPSPSVSRQDGPTPTAAGPVATARPAASAATSPAPTPAPTPAQPRPTRTPTGRGAPTAVLQTPDAEVTGVYGSYCWQDSPSRPAICADTFGFPETQEVLGAFRNQQLTLYFTRPGAPDRLEAVRYESPSFDAPKHRIDVDRANPTAVVARFGPGDHWLEVKATWEGKGMVPYYFEVQIS